MLEELNLEEMSDIKGGYEEGVYDVYCNVLQEQANTVGKDWTDKQWDRWGELYESYCMN
ncbi:hypothetical protein [Limibacterium fermenti]|jgi:hypothetical protein|uniref:hypothetical protein n=1 Tax=Limibacterium fermenti TaxID=3229863 RepID=UPI0026C21CCD